MYSRSTSIHEAQVMIISVSKYCNSERVLAHSCWLCVEKHEHYSPVKIIWLYYEQGKLDRIVYANMQSYWQY